MLFDLHVHTTYSACSRLLLGDILAHARRKGLDGVLITDHDTTEAMRWVRPGLQPDGLMLLVGMEYATDQGDFLVLGDNLQLASDLDAPDLINQVEDNNGITIAAHPFRKNRSVELALLNKPYVAYIEGINGRNQSGENRLALGLGQAKGKIMLGGSDAHALDELGRVVTNFDYPITGMKDLIKEIKAGHCRPMWGPGHLP
ncbi:PHP domain-containing protein [Dethiosulfatarculus sandiegensis]|uniref:Histidinol phosphatase n=1 Tax=Dethiosulfatarculus sandiegensis TaxID=1429043 RepID=A0A0D2HW32_9BACT|nr:PHP domain-containing protein [Dethiosulfatarculus sandiegensis]KIX14583.1 histidinol phosphatase [Dethiosulfatarculus sandiegensis]